MGFSNVLHASLTNPLNGLIAGLTTGLRSWLTPRAVSPKPGSQPGSPTSSSKPKGEPLPVSNPSRLAASLVDKPRSILFVLPAPRWVTALLIPPPCLQAIISRHCSHHDHVACNCLQMQEVHMVVLLVGKACSILFVVPAPKHITVPPTHRPCLQAISARDPDHVARSTAKCNQYTWLSWSISPAAFSSSSLLPGTKYMKVLLTRRPCLQVKPARGLSLLYYVVSPPETSIQRVVNNP